MGLINFLRGLFPKAPFCYYCMIGEKERERYRANDSDSTRISEKGYQRAIRGRCPDCNNKLKLGPSGGLSRNVRCTECGKHFNLTPFGVERLT